MSVHLKWPSFDNIHRGLISKKPLKLDPEPIVLVSEKLDGSNVCVEFNENGILAIGSRNLLIWSSDNDSKNVTLNTKDLSFLFGYEPNFKTLYSKLQSRIEMDNVNSLVVYGEFMPETLTYHPFGFGNHRHGHRMLCLEIWNIFRETGFNPPQIFFEGYVPLSEAIERLHPLMIGDDPKFEGVFLNLVDLTDPKNSYCKYGYKYKTPFHEEQDKFYYDLALSTIKDERFKPMLDKINEVFLLKSTMKLKTQVKPCMSLEQKSDIKHRITLAINSYISKNDIKSLPFEVAMKNITEGVLKDIDVTKKNHRLKALINQMVYSRVKSF